MKLIGNEVYVSLDKVMHVSRYLYDLYYNEVYTSQDGMTIVATHLNEDHDVIRNVVCKLIEKDGYIFINSVTELPNDDEVVCDSCGEIVPEDYILSDDRFTHDGNICEGCIKNGYGQ